MSAPIRAIVLMLATVVAAAPARAAIPPPAPPESFALIAGATGADPALLARLTAQVASAFDSTHGGWVAKRQVPSEAAVSLGFALARHGGPALWRSRALATVDWTWSLYDSVGGGFYERLANTKSDETSFEKNTASNAARLENLIEAWQETGDRVYRAKAAQVLDYMDRVLLDGRGGFIDGQVGSRDLVPRSNGRAIRAWLVWAAASADPRPRDFALKSLDRAWEEVWHPELGMQRRSELGNLQKALQLEDQVEMGRAYVLAAHLGGRARDLEHAKSIGDLLEKTFVDPKNGGWRTQAVTQKGGKIRNAASAADENSRAALFLAELASVSGEARWRDAARRGIDAFSRTFEKAGLEAAEWALAVRALGGADLPARPVWTGETRRPEVVKKR